MSVTHDFTCSFHGEFSARVEAGEMPPCPAGCSKEFVQLVFLEAPNIATERVRRATRMVKEAIDAQGLTDCDISRSTPGNSAADKNFLRTGNKVRAEVWSQDKVKGLLSSFPQGANAISGVGLGNPYRKDEWRLNEKTGQVVHSQPKGGAQFVKVRE